MKKRFLVTLELYSSYFAAANVLKSQLVPCNTVTSVWRLHLCQEHCKRRSRILAA